MNQAEIRKLIPALRVAIQPRQRKFRNPDGPEGRLNKMRATVTELVKNERIELNYNRADEARGYAERLIAEAIKYGDCHRPTMEMATFWLEEGQLVHKLFKVLVPRFKDIRESYTRIHKAPNVYPGPFLEKAVLELRGNPFPPLEQRKSTRNWLHNILLEEARRERTQQKRSGGSQE
ncbi:39S ribosomal protein L17, mitochondrial-like [Penaeus chinensis]|uniref:39S ribosomal protein L17, mitochondrial-like n=1 Tax=Penaeus chinensis TaxID=139456 RepID=UPI001FB6E7ED|nr:39S ribosomal protein L17, mitochondrial-like [Penaeus chinensis]